MWTQSLLKKNAWESVRNHYWMAFLACIIAGFLEGLGGRVSGGSSGGSSSMTAELESMMEQSGVEPAEVMEELIPVFVAVSGVMLIAWAVAIALAVFVSNPVSCGLVRFFINAREGEVNLSHLFGSFKSGRYMNTVKTLFFRDLYIFLWSLLLIIPGIIKTYEYALVPYLMSLNPSMDTNRALEISKKTMDGEKFNFFLLGLSFIGWYLLGIMACCVGVTFVNPYYYATMAEFYTCMKAKMISMGITTEDELTEGGMIMDFGYQA